MENQNQNQTNPLTCPTHKLSYLGTLVLGIIVGGGVACGYFLQIPVVGSASYKAGFDSARKLVEESQMGAVYKIPDDIRSIIGVVTKIDGNRITVKSESQNPFVDKNLLERVFLVSKETQITKISREGDEKFRAQMEEFIKNSADGKRVIAPLPLPPEPTRNTVTLSSVVVGNSVSVTATENIKDKREFTASAVEIF